MQFLQFLDRLIPYDTFLNDLAARIVKYLKSNNADPEFVSQRKAYEMFGRRAGMSKDGDGKGKWCATRDQAKWNTGRQTSASCNARFRTISIMILST